MYLCIKGQKNTQNRGRIPRFGTILDKYDGFESVPNQKTHQILFAFNDLVFKKVAMR